MNQYNNFKSINLESNQEAPSVDEEGVMVSFLQRVIDPERPFRPTIDLALARMGNLSVETGDRIGGSGGGGGGAMPNAMMHDNANMDMDDLDADVDGMGGDMVRDEGRGMHSNSGGGGGSHGYGGGGRHGHSSPMGGGMGYDEKPRVEAYSNRGMGGRDGGGGGGYGHELDHRRAPPHQMSSAPWEQDAHGGDMMPKVWPSLRRGRRFRVL